MSFTEAVQQYFAKRNEAETARLIAENRKLRQKLALTAPPPQFTLAKAA